MTSLQADYLLMASTTLRWTAEQMQELSKHVAIQPPKAFRSMTEDGRVKILDSKSNGPNSKAVYRLLRKENSTTFKRKQTLAVLRILRGQTRLQFQEDGTSKVIALNVWSEAAALGTVHMTERGQLSTVAGLISLTGPMDLFIIQEPGSGGPEWHGPKCRLHRVEEERRCDEVEVMQATQLTSVAKRPRTENETEWKPSYSTITKARGREQKVPKPGVIGQRVAARTTEFAKPAFDFDFVIMRMSQLGESRSSTKRRGTSAVLLYS